MLSEWTISCVYQCTRWDIYMCIWKPHLTYYLGAAYLYIIFLYSFTVSVIPIPKSILFNTSLGLPSQVVKLKSGQPNFMYHPAALIRNEGVERLDFTHTPGWCSMLHGPGGSKYALTSHARAWREVACMSRYSGTIYRYLWLKIVVVDAVAQQRRQILKSIKLNSEGLSQFELAKVYMLLCHSLA